MAITGRLCFSVDDFAHHRCSSLTKHNELAPWLPSPNSGPRHQNRTATSEIMLLFALQYSGAAHVRVGSWPCDNAEAGSLTGSGCSATMLGEVCEHIFPISSATQPDAAPRIVSAPGPDRQAKVRAHHALTAAIIGLTPTMFSIRVKL